MIKDLRIEEIGEINLFDKGSEFKETQRRKHYQNKFRKKWLKTQLKISTVTQNFWKYT